MFLLEEDQIGRWRMSLDYLRVSEISKRPVSSLSSMGLN